MKMTGMIAMFVGSFIVQYFVMSSIMVNNLQYNTNNLGKAYLSAFMGVFMVFIEVALHDHQYHVFSLKTYVLLAIGLGLFVYLYRNQVAIYDKEYLKGMIEHHSMALLTSKNILEKTKNPAVINFATKIVVGQKNEIEDMRYLLNSI